MRLKKTFRENGNLYELDLKVFGNEYYTFEVSWGNSNSVQLFSGLSDIKQFLQQISPLYNSEIRQKLNGNKSNVDDACYLINKLYGNPKLKSLNNGYFANSVKVKGRVIDLYLNPIQIEKVKSLGIIKSHIKVKDTRDYAIITNDLLNKINSILYNTYKLILSDIIGESIDTQSLTEIKYKGKVKLIFLKDDEYTRFIKSYIKQMKESYSRKFYMKEDISTEIKDFIVSRFMNSKFAIDITKEITNKMLDKLDIEVKLKN